MTHARSMSVALLLLVSAACTATTEGSPADEPSAAPQAGETIVFNRVTPESWAVYTLDLGTGDEQEIREVEEGVGLSPDGSRFLGAWPMPDGRIGPATFDVDGSDYSPLPIDDPTLQLGYVTWSPDGTRVLAQGWDDTDPSRGGLYTVRSTDGGGLERVTDPGDPPHDYPVAYSPDGSRILLFREVKPYGHSGPMDVFVVRSDGTGAVRLNPPGITSGQEAQSWSPDGRRVAFVATRGLWSVDDRPSAVFVVDADGGTARRITPWGVTLRAAWSPNGQWIAYDAESPTSSRDIFIVHPDGTQRTNITSSEDGEGPWSWAPVWSPDSSGLLFVRFAADGGDPNLWIVNVDGTDLRQVTDGPTDAEYGAYRWLPSIT